MVNYKPAAALALATCLVLAAGCSSSDSAEPGLRSDGTPKKDLPAKVANDIAERERAAGDPAGAVAFYRRALAIDPDQPKTTIALGNALMETGANAEAADLFRKALAKSPENTDAMSGLGVALVRLGQPGPAVDLLHKGMESAPTVRGYRALGVADSLLGRTHEAEADFSKGLALAPQDVSLRSNLGLAQVIAGDTEPGLVNLRAAAASSSSTPQYRQNLALGLGLAGRMDEAGQIARIDLDETAVRSNLAFYARLRDMTPAERGPALMHGGAASPGAS